MLLGGLALIGSLGAGEIAVERRAPFDRWCIAPICSHVGVVHPPVIELPTPVVPAATLGLLESKLLEHVTDDIESTVHEANGQQRILTDLSRALRSAIESDTSDANRAEGVAGAAVRLALIFAVEDSIASDPQCSSLARYEAIYEGLAASASLAPLTFPGARHSVAPACLPTAQAAAAEVDRVALHVLEPVAAPILDSLGGASEQIASVCPSAMPLTIRHLRDSVVQCRDVLQGYAIERAELDPFEDADLSGFRDMRARGTLIARVLSSISAKRRVEADIDVFGLLLARAEERFSGVNRIIFHRLITPLRVSLVKTATGAMSIDTARLLTELKTLYRFDVLSVAGVDVSAWAVDVSAGFPSLRTADLRVAGDARIGYGGTNFKLLAKGGAKYFDFTKSSVETEDARYYGGLDLSWVTGDAAKRVRVEILFATLVDYIDTTTINHPALPRDLVFGDYDSLLLRGSFLAGLRARPLDTLALRVSGGGGATYETHDTTSVARGVRFDSVDNTSWQSDGHALVTWGVIPRIMGLRARADASYFAVTIDRLSFASSAGATISRIDTRRFELSTRLFVDLDVARFGGFAPCAFGGLDLTSLGAGAGSATSPIAGVALLRRDE